MLFSILRKLAAVVTVSVEILGSYNTESYLNKSGSGTGPTGQTAPAAMVASNVVAGVLWRGSVTPGFSTTAGGSLFWSTAGTPASEADSVAAGDYFEFDVDAQDGVYLDLVSFSVAFGGSDVNRFGAYDATVYVQVDTGAGFYTVGSKTIPIAEGAPNTNVAQDVLEVDLESFSYERLSHLSVRVGAYDTVDRSSCYVRAQDIQIKGKVRDIPSNQYCFIGAYPNDESPLSGPDDNELDRFRATTGRGMNVFMFYGNFGNGTTNQDAVSTYAFERAETQNLLPFYKLSPILKETEEDGDDNNIDEAATSRVYQDMADGVYDDFLHYCAQKIAAYDCPSIVMDFAHEMNGGWKGYHVTDFGTANGPANFIAAWRHLVDIFNQEGLQDRVLWSFAPDATYDPPSTSTYYHVSNYYPGNDVVDLVGCSAYAKGTRVDFSLPEMLHTVWTDLMEACSNSKPFILSECSAVDEAGGYRPDWLRDNFTPEIFRQYKITLFNWFNQDGATTSQALDDEASQDAFREVMADDFFMGEYCTLQNDSGFLSWNAASGTAAVASTESTSNDWRMIMAPGFDDSEHHTVYLMNREAELFLHGEGVGQSIELAATVAQGGAAWNLDGSTNGQVRVLNEEKTGCLHNSGAGAAVEIIPEESAGSGCFWHLDPQ